VGEQLLISGIEIPKEAISGNAEPGLRIYTAVQDHIPIRLYICTNKLLLHVISLKDYPVIGLWTWLKMIRKLLVGFT